MYNGIGLTTPRGSGTNGFVTRNLSSVRKTKEKIAEYSGKDDAAVRPFDIELIEHERRRQAEVRCLELQELLEEQEIPDDEIAEKVNAFRAKLLAEKKSGVARDSSGRPILKDSHELAMQQEAKNEKAKDAFGIRADYVPGSSMESNNSNREKARELGAIVLEAPKPAEKPKVEKEKEKKKKKSHKRRASTSSSSSSSSGSSSDEETRRKKKKKDKKKKSKKSHHHHKRDDRSRSREKDRNRSRR